MEFSKIVYYDLMLEARRGRLPPLVGRLAEQQRLARILGRRLGNNCLVCGPSGIGKTTLLHSAVKNWLTLPASKARSAVELEARSFYALSSPTSQASQRYEEALATLPPALVLIDDFGDLVYNKLALLQNLFVLLKPLLESPDFQVILSSKPEELDWICEQEPGFAKWFEIMRLKNQPAFEQIQILKLALSKLKDPSPVPVSEDTLQLIIEVSQRFPALGQLPRSAISLLDESLALASSQASRLLTPAEVLRVTADKTNIPFSQLAAPKTAFLKNLEAELNAVVRGQAAALKIITAAICRAKLGLKNPQRPLGSFLFLGPSGVGKTETARQLAGLVFGKKENFVRLDMSEFAQEHTVQRLLGAPPGYVGYEAGGYLTNAVKVEPHSLILLDEIEKAHPRAFDIFLQILEDGRLTSGQGETVDFSQGLLLATSNLAVAQIVQGFQEGRDIASPGFFQEKILPELLETFRPEFLNRFDAVVVFKPLTLADLLAIARLEIKKIEERASKHRIKFRIDQKALQDQVASFLDWRFGARPLKRFLEERCETLITKTLLK